MFLCHKSESFICLSRVWIEWHIIPDSCSSLAECTPSNYWL